METTFTERLNELCNKHFSLFYDFFKESFDWNELYELAELYVLDKPKPEILALFNDEDFNEDFKDSNCSLKEFLYAYFEDELWKHIENCYYTIDYHQTDAYIEDQWAKRDYEADLHDRALDAAYGW